MQPATTTLDLDELRDAWSILAPEDRLHGFRLLARNLALGYQLAQVAEAAEAPVPLAEPHAFCATQVEGLGQFLQAGRTIYLRPLQPTPGHRWALPWTRLTVRLAS